MLGTRDTKRWQNSGGVVWAAIKRDQEGWKWHLPVVTGLAHGQDDTIWGLERSKRPLKVSRTKLLRGDRISLAGSFRMARKGGLVTGERRSPQSPGLAWTQTGCGCQRGGEEWVWHFPGWWWAVGNCEASAPVMGQLSNNCRVDTSSFRWGDWGSEEFSSWLRWHGRCRIKICFVFPSPQWAEAEGSCGIERGIALGRYF